ncbi:MAG: glycoside hydrolase family 88 protein [Bacteroidota bacterium]|nr:glycoside hydrolase family 88 protein [Bacteroidota bacterium]
MKIILYSFGLLLLAVSASCTKSNNYDLTKWPAEADPHRVGLLLAEKYLATPHKNSGDVTSEEPPSQIVYSEVCTWLGSIWFAEVSGNKELLSELRDRFDPLFDTLSNLLPPPNHVDNNVFGSVPLEFYLADGGKKYLDLGLYYADTQWTLPDSAGPEEKAYAGRGYTWQTRIWIDDMFMITAVQSQAYRATGDIKYIDRAAKEMILYLDTIQLENGLFYHAPYAHFSWGRGNGWMAAGMSEILRAMPENHPDRPRIMEGYRKMMAALLLHQADDGMWRQVIDDKEFWKETSSTAMFTYAMITGVKNGWLDEKTYGTAARKAWLSLVTYISEDGNLTDVCEGTGTSTDRSHYLKRKRNTGDFHGQAPVLWCTAALLR